MGMNNILLVTVIISQVIIISACSICSAENSTENGSENSSVAQTTQYSQQQDSDESTSLEATTAHEVITFEPMYITVIPHVQNRYASGDNKSSLNNKADDRFQNE